jgi:hypothetical protein
MIYVIFSKVKSEPFNIESVQINYIKDKDMKNLETYKSVIKEPFEIDLQQIK